MWWSRRLYLNYCSGLVGRIAAGLKVVMRSAATVIKRDKKAEATIMAKNVVMWVTPMRASPPAENIKEAKALNILRSTSWSITAIKKAEKQEATSSSNMAKYYQTSGLAKSI